MSVGRFDFTDPAFMRSRPGAKLLYLSQESYSEEWQNVQHTHKCSELFYILEGKGSFVIENKKYPVEMNDLVVINPNILHTEVGEKEFPLKYIVLGIEGLEWSANEEGEVVNFCILNFKKMRSQVIFFLQNMLLEITQKSPGYYAMCHHYMDILILMLNRQTNFSAAAIAVNKKATRLCDSIRRYIDAHYWENITLDVLAKVFHSNKYHIVHLFTEEFGISPIQYLIARRIEEGEKLLQTTDFSLAQISRFCGFSSPSYFSQVFKKQKNCSPKEFRKNSKKSNES